MSLNKIHVHAALTNALNEKYQEMRASLAETDDSLSSDAKSTAGDKHETGRAMAQLEREKIGGFIQKHEQLMALAQRLEPALVTPTICLGSLVKTSNGYYYISVGFGRILADDTAIFCISPAAPLVAAILGKKSGDELLWQGKPISIETVH